MEADARAAAAAGGGIGGEVAAPSGAGEDDGDGVVERSSSVGRFEGRSFNLPRIGSTTSISASPNKKM
jgi:hypothetical protein